jgi:hypothetical protein
MSQHLPERSTPRGRLLRIVAALAVLVAAISVPATPVAEASVTILNHKVKPTTPVDSDRSGVELGVKFTSTRAGTITAIQFYRNSAQKTVYKGSIWSARGKRLATAKFPARATAGWQGARLTKPVRVSAGQTLIASYYTPNGSYAATNSAFLRDVRRNGFIVRANGGVYRYGNVSGFPTDSWMGSNYFVDVVFQPSPVTAPPPPTPKPTPKPTPTVEPTKPSSPGFPTASNTGVPAGTTLTNYTGPCTVSVPDTVIDAKMINCSLIIEAKGVVISRSRINGSISNDAGGSSFTIRDSEVNTGKQLGTGIGNLNYTALRVHVTGGNRSMNCDANCLIQDSYVHGQFRDESGLAHESGIRMSENTVLRHNTILCDAPDVPPDAGCSADLTGYGDFAVVQNNLIENNLFKASTGGYCAYGGSTTGKAYSKGVNHIRFIDNVFERGKFGKCGVWGPITSFDSDAPGNVWRGNVWDDGVEVPPAN